MRHAYVAGRGFFAVLASAAFLGSASLASGAVGDLVLKPAQVGPGYRLHTFPGGNRVAGQVSLDLCNFVYPSERDRVARLQVLYTRAGAPSMSNEVVEYTSNATASGALAELRWAVKHCPSTPMRSPVKGQPPASFRLTRLHDGRLLSTSVAVAMHVTSTVGGKRQQLDAVAVYQVHGRMLSAVYSRGNGTVAAQKRLALQAAARSAGKLRRDGG